MSVKGYNELLADVALEITAALAAAISLLERGGKMAAPSNKMFQQMLKDYKKALDNARKVLGDTP